jgi:hypothetical protein
MQTGNAVDQRRMKGFSGITVPYQSNVERGNHIIRDSLLDDIFYRPLQHTLTLNPSPDGKGRYVPCHHSLEERNAPFSHWEKGWG